MKTVSFARILLAISLGLGVHAIGLAQDSDRDAAADEEGAPEALPGLPTLQRLNTPLSALTLPTRAAAPTVFDKMPPDKSDGLFAGSSANASRGTRRPWAPACVRLDRARVLASSALLRGRAVGAIRSGLEPQAAAGNVRGPLLLDPLLCCRTSTPSPGPGNAFPISAIAALARRPAPCGESLPWDRRAALAECLIVTGVAVAVP